MLYIRQHCSYSALNTQTWATKLSGHHLPPAFSTKVDLHAIEPSTNIVTFEQDNLDQIAAVAGPIWLEGNWLP